MAPRSKWIEVDSADEPVTAVAQRAIESRLRTVWYWLPKADAEGEHDSESVHQLRVSTRRAMAAIDIFESMLPRGKTRWFRKQLKRVRKAAGPARDLDVLAKRLADLCATEEAVGGAALLDRVAAARREAQAPIGEVHRELSKRSAQRRAKKLVAKVGWRQSDVAEPTFNEAAHSGLRLVATDFFTAAQADMKNTQALHAFRIAAKRLRYAMEVFAGAFGPSFRKELYPLIEQLQEKLGAVNDHATAQARYSQWLDDTADEGQRAALGRLITAETAALEDATRSFSQWWTPQRAADLKSRFWEEVSPSEARCA